MRVYRYVGPPEIALRAGRGPAGVPVHTATDAVRWVTAPDREMRGGLVVATFVVDATGLLRLADRRSEHVACAAGEPVLSAGELTFAVGPPVAVVSVSNQSTGYCPEPASFPAVRAALLAAGVDGPDRFEPACEFRRCTGCGGLTLVKDCVFECEACGAALSAAYNCQPDG